MKYFFLILGLLAIGLVFKTLAHSETLIREYSFDDKELEDCWFVEGPGTAKIINGKLVLEPTFYTKMKKLMNKQLISKNNIQDEYSPYLKMFFKEKGYDVEQYSITRKNEKYFRGGHFNIWNKNIHPENFAIEFDFRSLSPASLHMIMFCSNSIKHKDIFTNNKRVGLSQEIMHGDMAQYRISYFHPQRKTANMRKAPGRQMIAQGHDFTSNNERKFNKCRIERRNSKDPCPEDMALSVGPLKGGLKCKLIERF